MSTKIYGASDDLIEFDGEIYGEIESWDSPALIKLQSSNEYIEFTFTYSGDGCWRFNCDQYTDEELSENYSWLITRLPENWDSSMENTLGYSDILIIPDIFKEAFYRFDNSWVPVS